MSLGSRAIGIGGRSILKSARPALSTPREPLLFLYPRFIRTAASEQEIAASVPRFHDVTVERNASSNEPLQDVEASGGTSEAHDGTAMSARDETFNDNSDRSRRVFAKLRSSAQRRIARDEYEDTTRRMWRGIKKEATGDIDEDFMDWRKILFKLFENTAQGILIPRENGVEVTVPRSAVNTLLFDIDNSIWEIKQRTTCDIQMLPPDETTIDTRILLLSGLSEQVYRACDELRRIVPTCKYDFQDATAGSDLFLNTSPIRSLRPDLTTEDMPSNPNLVRGVRTQDYDVVEDLEKIEEPTAWTKSSFQHHVLRLTKSKPGYTLYQHPLDHTVSVRTKLTELFEGRKLKEVISLNAFHVALSYFMRTGQIKDARRLFVSMEVIGLKMDTETFNIMLRGASKIHDLHNFGFLLGMMLKRGHKPDAGTWLAFLKTVTSFEIKAHIIAGMRRKGMLRQISVVQKLCSELAGLETQWSILRKESHDEFIDHMDKRYGPHWLSTDSANHILYQLGAHGLFSRTFTFVNLMKTRHVKPNQTSLRIVINRCRLLTNFESSLHALRVFSELAVEPDSAVYNDLFHMALSARMYSFSRVVWRYACLNHATSWSMRKTLSTMALRWTAFPGWRRHIPEGHQLSGYQWQLYAGKVILGNIKLDEHPAIIQPEAEEDTGKETARRSDKTDRLMNVESPTALAMFIRKQMNLDLSIHRCWVPVRDFADILEDAHHSDVKWKRDKPWNKQGIKALMKNAKMVPVTPKEEIGSKLIVRHWGEMALYRHLERGPRLMKIW